MIPKRITLNVIINPTITSISLVIDERGGEQPVRAFAFFIVDNIHFQWVHLERQYKIALTAEQLGGVKKNPLMESWEHL